MLRLVRFQQQVSQIKMDVKENDGAYLPLIGSALNGAILMLAFGLGTLPKRIALHRMNAKYEGSGHPKRLNYNNKAVI